MARLFISHSSLDDKIVNLFKDVILKEGLGFTDEDIAYSSRVETGVTLGYSIPQFIKENLKTCDYVFFMISDNYRRSEVCLNEMGAAWALDKIVKPFLLYHTPFKAIGWLYDKNLCADIDNGEILDELHDELKERYGLKVKTSVWNRKKAEFVEKVSELDGPVEVENQITITTVENDEPEEGPLGFLDYRERFDDANREFVENVEILTQEFNNLRDFVKIKDTELRNAKSKPNSVQISKSIVIEIAKRMNKLSRAIKDQLPIIDKKYCEIIANAKGMYGIPELGGQLKSAQRDSLMELVNKIESAKADFNKTRKTINELYEIEQSQIIAKKKMSSQIGEIIRHFSNWVDLTNEQLNL